MSKLYKMRLREMPFTATTSLHAETTSVRDFDLIGYIGRQPQIDPLGELCGVVHRTTECVIHYNMQGMATLKAPSTESGLAPQAISPSRDMILTRTRQESVDTPY